MTGVYCILSGATSEVFEQGGTLYFRRGTGPSKPLAALSSTTLTVADSEGAYVLDFKASENGRGATLRVTARCELVETATRTEAAVGGPPRAGRQDQLLDR